MTKIEGLRRHIRQLVGEYAEQQLMPLPYVEGITAIPPSGKLLDAAEIQHMVDAALDGWLTAGRFNQTFEKQLAQFLGVQHVLTVNSGSSANLIAFTALTSPRLKERAIRTGDEVITVAAGFPTTVNPILQCGAVPVFVDVELGTYNVNASLLEAAITPKTRAIVLAHTLGNPFNLQVVTDLCQKHGLWLVEDCCDALGATYQGRKVGSFSDIATLSFYPAHHITTGEGGAVFTNNPELATIAESLRDWGRDCHCPGGRDNTCGARFCQSRSVLGELPAGYDHKYVYSHLGYNLKITDIQAACGVAQMDKVERFIAQRRENFTYLHMQLQDCVEHLILPRATRHTNPSWFGFPITLRANAPVTRLDLLTYLAQNNVGTRLLFAGNLTRQPSMQGRNWRVEGQLSNTDCVMENTFWIGVQPALTPAMLDFAASRIRAFLGVDFD